MRLWTVHPRYLDARGLCALWREALLAQAVLLGRTKGYRNHPQLTRFREQSDPVRSVCSYLLGVYAESVARGYDFDLAKIEVTSADLCMNETEGQLLWEWEHLKTKLEERTPELLARHGAVTLPEPHPMFRIVAGPIREWERAAGLPN